jgi:hypothetical protein
VDENIATLEEFLYLKILIKILSSRLKDEK